MNKSKIEWCDRTWNPVTGCLHNCEYCYARKIAKRFNPIDKDGKSFQPAFHEDRLNEPQKCKTPQNIFVCSMADLFGEWVPDEWIKAVFEACEKAPQHRYLFLTKNPKRYWELAEKGLLPQCENFWYGITVNKQVDANRLADLLNTTPSFFPQKRFVSIEPIQERIYISYGAVSWVIVGGESGNRKNKITPEKLWLDHIIEQCDFHETPLFMKDSLAGIWGEKLIQQYPWEV